MTFENEILKIITDDFEKYEKDFRIINDKIKESDLNYNGRCVQTLAVPKIISSKLYAHIADFIDNCFSLFNKIIKQYLTNPNYRKLFDFSPELEELILLSDPEKCLIPMARVDFFLNEENFDIMLCEINTDGTSAMNEDRILGELLQYNHAFQFYTQNKSYEQFELFDSWVCEFLEIYKTSSGDNSTPRIVIADFLDKSTLNEFKQFRKAFLNRGIQAEICDIRKLTYENNILKTPDGLTVDAIYRRAVTVDIMSNYKDVLPFINAVKDGSVYLIGEFCTQIIHNKQIFHTLFHPDTLSFLTKKEIDFVKKHFPATYVLCGVSVKENHVISQKDNWLIKPFDSYGSKGVYAGVNYSDKDWSELVLSNIGNDYLLQRFTKPYKTPNIDFSEDFPSVKNYSNITGVFCYNEKPYGIYSRLAKGEIISSQYDEKTIATILI